MIVLQTIGGQVTKVPLCKALSLSSCCIIFELCDVELSECQGFPSWYQRMQDEVPFRTTCSEVDM